MNIIKLHRKLFIVLLVCALMCILSVTAFAGETEEQYGYQQLENQVQREIYVAIRDGVAQLDNPISFTVSDTDFTGEDIQLAAEMVSEDYPEYFWFTCGWSGEVYSSGLVKLTMVYEIGGESVTSVDPQYDAMMNEVEALLDGMPANADSDYEKALYLHDALARHTEYVFTDNDQTAYGALVEGQAVCAGYARAYQLLLEAAGIQAWIVEGNSVDPGSGSVVPHAWNLMWLDDDCYYTDVTWDDQDDLLFHEFFCRSKEEFSSTHAPDMLHQKALPECAHEGYDYFVLEVKADSGVGGIVNDSTPLADIFNCTKVLQQGSYTHATVSILYTGSDINTWINQYCNYIANTLGLNRYSCYYNGMTNEYQITVVTGVGGVFARAESNSINLTLCYQNCGLVQGREYNIVVAYYTEDGRFVGTDMLQITLDYAGKILLSASCPEMFDTCKVFMPEAVTFAPLTAAITALQK